ncbi:MAG: aminopeptidase, partial [Pseudomonadota bacterium]|nr:aminopeptidase [Pseudomonadota bacterium]
MRRLSLLLVASLWAGTLQGQGIQQTKGSFQDKFRQLDEVLPTANVYRNAAGAPGHAYWQQEVDYNIEAVLDEDAQRLSATELIRYQNNSPDTLTYLWFQLDQNRFRSDSMAEMSGTFNGSSPDADSNDAARISLGQLRAL